MHVAARGHRSPALICSGCLSPQLGGTLDGSAPHALLYVHASQILESLSKQVTAIVKNDAPQHMPPGSEEEGQTKVHGSVARGGRDREKVGPVGSGGASRELTRLASTELR